jgi:hypothetical protein
MFFAPLAIVGAVVFVALGGQIVRLLWNWLLPPILGLPEITFWQALGLLVLSRILFGGFGSHGRGGGSRLRRRISERMADRVAARLQHMTPEERERFRQRLRERCGFDLAGSEGR